MADIKDHLANERTFLAWVRTSLGIMAFGFVVEKFSLFLKQIAYLLGVSPLADKITPPHLQGYSSTLGIVLVACGAILCLFSFIQYRKIREQIEKNDYKSLMGLDLLLTGLVVATGIFLVFYLIVGIK